MRRKEERSKQGQTNNKAHSTPKVVMQARKHSRPKVVSFLKKNELPRMGLKPTTLYTLRQSALPRQLSWLAQISHLVYMCTS